MKRRDFVALLFSVTAGWPLVGSAQEPSMPVIGFLSGRSQAESTIDLSAFHRGLGEAGYFATRNVAVEYRWADGDYNRLPALASELVRQEVSVIAAGGLAPALAAKAATRKTPIIFVVGDDPVRAGLVSSLNSPGSNLTGITLTAGPLPSKRLELVREMIPTIKTVAVLINPNNAVAEEDTLTAQKAAHSVGLDLVVTSATSEKHFDGIFEMLSHARIGALLVNTDAFFTSRRDLLVAHAAHHSIPAIYPFSHYTAAGGLMSYGPSLSNAYDQVGRYIGKILKGASTAELPVQQATRFELVINLRTAQKLGLTVPPTLLARADELIE
jgi:putative ABC transport system substrate-binding protein